MKTLYELKILRKKLVFQMRVKSDVKTQICSRAFSIYLPDDHPTFPLPKKEKLQISKLNFNFMK